MSIDEREFDFGRTKTVNLELYPLLLPMMRERSFKITVECSKHGIRSETYPWPETEDQDEIKSWVGIVRKVQLAVHYASGCDEHPLVTWGQAEAA